MPILGCVPYLNAKPLTAAFERGILPGFQVRYEVPSALPALMDQSAVDGILVSSIEALRRPDLAIAPGVSISTFGAVESVRIFHRRPLGEIHSIALDQSSMTSNALAKIVLRQKYSCEPESCVMPPDLDSMLRRCDAALLIGDPGMRDPGPGVTATDLGREWHELTGKPFVWAVWLLRDAEIAEPLLAARKWGEAHLDAIIPVAARETGFPEPQARHYLTEVMDYRLGPEHLAGLEEFRARLAAIETPVSA